MKSITQTLIIVSAFVVLLASAHAAPSAPAPLPPAAQEAVNKGIIAAKVPDYLLAIRHFEEARKLAPDAPVVYLNMGLAESRIPGRELRAMAWFGAYLAAYPDAPNAAAVKEQIGCAGGEKPKQHLALPQDRSGCDQPIIKLHEILQKRPNLKL